MSPDQQQPPAKQPTISAEGLQAFYAEFGQKAHIAHELAAQLAQIRTVSAALIEQHAPGTCQPIQTEADEEPTPLAGKRRAGG